MIPTPFYKWPPGKKKTNSKNQQASLYYFFPEQTIAASF
jgi:hypothetical protein